MHKNKIMINGAERTLSVKVSPFRGKHKVFLDGQLIGEFANNKESKEGKEFKIDFNNFVNIRYDSKFLTPELYISHNGQELETSASHPTARKNNAWGLILFLAGMNGIIGLVGMSNAIPAFTQSGYGLYNVFMAVFYCIAVMLFKTFTPFLGIVLALVLYSIDSVVVLMALPTNPGISGAVIVRIMFFGLLIRGLSASYPEFKLSLSKR